MEELLQESLRRPDEVVMLYQDECSFYRQPTQGWLWAHLGRQQPKLRWSHKANTLVRVAGALNARTGQVHYHLAAAIRVPVFTRFLLSLGKAYPQAKRIGVVLDNWPVHFHPEVFKGLEADPRIELVPLPTYAPWLNAMEKVWRLLRQKLTHGHPYCDDFTLFKARILELLGSLGKESGLLRYVGLVE